MCKRYRQPKGIEMTEHNNPPAFPTKQPLSSDFLGMTLLDHFAGLAMQGVVNEEYMTQEQMAQWCYEMADAMLKERAKWVK